MVDGPVAEAALQAVAPVGDGEVMKIRHIDSKKIENAIADFESQVDFEFIPVIARKSSYVEHISWVLSLLFLVIFIGLIDALFATVWVDSWISRTPFYIASPFVAFLFGVLLDKSDWVDRFFITKAERARQVREKAELTFYRQRLHELKSKNALLLYISEMERQLVVFHDPRIEFDKMQQLDEELIRVLQGYFKKHDFEQGLLKAIEHLQITLAPHFPKNSQSAGNVVPNKLIWLDEN